MPDNQAQGEEAKVNFLINASYLSSVFSGRGTGQG
jgi:hypothetical protein